MCFNQHAHPQGEPGKPGRDGADGKLGLPGLTGDPGESGGEPTHLVVMILKNILMWSKMLSQNVYLNKFMIFKVLPLT